MQMEDYFVGLVKKGWTEGPIPPAEEGVFYIVTEDVKAELKDRPDVLGLGEYCIYQKAFKGLNS